MTSSLDIWANSIANRLYVREAQYRRSKQEQRSGADPEAARIDATIAATFSLLELTQALEELPQFRGMKGLLPFQDLVQALGDLVNGSQPSLLTRRSGVGKGKDTFGRRYIKKQAVAGVRCLRAVGLNEKDACGLVAREFAAAGVLGRKRRRDGSYSIDRGTILNWVLSAPDHEEEHRQIDEFVSTWKADTIKPMTRESVAAWIKETALSPEIKSKI